jgi:hypothetical protein
MISSPSFRAYDVTVKPFAGNGTDERCNGETDEANKLVYEEVAAGGSAIRCKQISLNY